MRFSSKVKEKNQERFSVLWRNEYDCSKNDSGFHLRKADTSHLARYWEKRGARGPKEEDLKCIELLE